MSRSLYFLLLLGLAFIGVGLERLYQTIRQTSGAQEISGEVIDPHLKGLNGKKVFSAVVEYHDEMGNKRYLVSKYKRYILTKYRNQGSGFHPGESVTVLVNHKTGWSEIKIWKIWSGPITLIGIGASLSVLFGIAWGKRRVKVA